jgi:hypothetical protein
MARRTNPFAQDDNPAPWGLPPCKKAHGDYLVVSSCSSSLSGPPKNVSLASDSVYDPFPVTTSASKAASESDA